MGSGGLALRCRAAPCALAVARAFAWSFAALVRLAFVLIEVAVLFLLARPVLDLFPGFAFEVEVLDPRCGGAVVELVVLRPSEVVVQRVFRLLSPVLLRTLFP